MTLLQLFDVKDFMEIVQRNYGSQGGSKRVNVEDAGDAYAFFVSVPDDYCYVFVVKKVDVSEVERLNFFANSRKVKYVDGGYVSKLLDAYSKYVADVEAERARVALEKVASSVGKFGGGQ